jgi:segregation and condensation protein A
MIDSDSDSDNEARSGDESAESVPAGEPRQEEMPFAVVEGVAVTELPRDLYIPPNALEVFLEAFEGPLDLLLYLIKRQNLDILNIPIAEITRQYMEYVDLMKDLRLELAGEYLVMAAMLAEIKSRMLLPRPELENEEEGDPRAELVRRLQEYERYKQAAEDIDELPRLGRDLFPTEAGTPFVQVVKRQPTVRVEDLVMALADVFRRARMYSHHHVQVEPLSVRERMSSILVAVGKDNYTEFTSLFSAEEGRRGVIVTLLAVLELVREMLIELLQAKPLGPIHVRAHTS